MKLLVFSDSHSSLSFMRRSIEKVKPDTIIHLGDYYDDGQVMGELFPQARLIQVPGNCDRYRCTGLEPEVVFVNLDGIGVFLTHGHLHRVKSGIGGQLAAARTARADVALFGHTHEALCLELEDGLRVMNPGSCGSSGGSVGLIETERGKIRTFRILNTENMGEFE